MLNDKVKRIFVLGEHGVFDWGLIAMRNRYCPLRIYNKDKTNKFRVDFSSWQMPSIISSIILVCNKVIIQKNWHPPITIQPTQNTEMPSTLRMENISVDKKL